MQVPPPSFNGNYLLVLDAVKNWGSVFSTRGISPPFGRRAPNKQTLRYITNSARRGLGRRLPSRDNAESKVALHFSLFGVSGPPGRSLSK
jgi:hypothetical protein